MTPAEKRALGRVIDGLNGDVLRYREGIDQARRALETLRRFEQTTLEEIAAVRSLLEGDKRDPLDSEGVLWVAALDCVPIADRTAWVAELSRRVEAINAERAR